MYKFSRKYELKFIIDPDGVRDVLPTILNPLTLEFVITRASAATQSDAHFRIYNLGQDIRNRLFRDDYATFLPMSEIIDVEFSAGYEGILPIVFKGKVATAKSYRVGGSTNFVTDVSSYGEGDDISNSWSRRTIPAGATKQSAIKDLMSDFKSVEQGTVSSKYADEVFVRSQPILGNTLNELRKLTGGCFFIDNGIGHVLKNGESIEGETIIINSDTGLLGVPVVAGYTVTAEMLFEPRVSVGQRVLLVSEGFGRTNGEYIVMGITHKATISDAVGGKATTTLLLQNPELAGV